MTLRRDFKLGQSEFNDFLFALVGEEKNGQEITVLSALSRLGLDPWREAARLSSLSKAAATQSLMVTIASLPEGNWKPDDREAIATRLIAGLPTFRSKSLKVRIGHKVGDSAVEDNPKAGEPSRASLGREKLIETILRTIELPNWLIWILFVIAVLFMMSRLYVDANYGPDAYMAPAAVEQRSVVAETLS